MPDESPTGPPRSSPPDVSVAPGWYAVDKESNAQAYWDGERWTKTRRWRGTGWVEDADTPVATTVGADTATAMGAGPGPSGGVGTATGVDAGSEDPAPRVSRYLPPPTRTQPTYPRSPYYPPSPGSYQPAPARPMVQTTNGSAVASLVLSILGLFGIGSLLGIIFGYRARRESRSAGGDQRGEGLATAGIVIGYVTLVIFVVFIGLWIALFAAIHSTVDSASAPVAQCQADAKSVEVALDAYQAHEGSYPAPPAAWNAGSYASNYAPLTSATNGGPYLNVPPAVNDYVIEYDSSGTVWVAPADSFELVSQPNQDFNANPDACNTAVTG